MCQENERWPAVSGIILQMGYSAFGEHRRLTAANTAARGAANTAANAARKRRGGKFPDRAPPRWGGMNTGAAQPVAQPERNPGCMGTGGYNAISAVWIDFGIKMNEGGIVIRAKIDKSGRMLRVRVPLCVGAAPCPQGAGIGQRQLHSPHAHWTRNASPGLASPASVLPIRKKTHIGA